MFGSLTKIPVRQLKILILNPLSLLVYKKNMSAYYMTFVYSGWYAATWNTYLNLFNFLSRLKAISVYTLQK